MEDIFEIKFPIEQEIKEKVIIKFSNKQGGAYNIFSYYWQCFVWAATIGFLRNERRKLSTGIERVFSLNTMKANGGERDAQALICMCIARSGSIDIMKNPVDAILQISEYANGGFYHIMKLMENGENSFNDLEKVKQEIFARDYDINGNMIVNPSTEFNHKDEETHNNNEEDLSYEIKSENPTKARRWTPKDEGELVRFYKSGMTIEQLTKYFDRNEDDVKEKLKQKGINV